jgi:RimJ/RimL family protein N-acetyltransferase
MYISPEYWNIGFGSFAVKQLEEWFPEMYKMTTGTPSFSVGNIHFYEKLGFTKTGESYCEDEQINLIIFEKLYSQ